MKIQLFSNKIITIFTILLLFPFFLNGQKNEKSQFETQLEILDSLRAYTLANNCISYADSLIESGNCNQRQIIELEILKGGYYANNWKDSLATISLDKGYNYLISSADTNCIAYANVWEGKGSVARNQNDFKLAEKYYLKCEKIQKIILDKDHPDHGKSLNNLGLIYYATGQNEKAEPYLVNAQINRSKSLSKGHPDYLRSVNNLSLLYINIGEYEKAESLINTGIELIKIHHGISYYLYSTYLSNLALVYLSMENYKKAIPILKEALVATEKAFGKKEHMNYIANLSNLALAYEITDEITKAKTTYNDLENLIIKVVGKEHPYYMQVRYNQGILYQVTKDFQKAEQYLLEAKMLSNKLFGNENPNYNSSLGRLVMLYGETNQKQKAIQTVLEYNNLTKNLLKKSFNFLSEKEKIKYHERKIGKFTFVKAIAQQFQTSEILEEVYNTILFEKGIHLNASNQTKSFILSQKDTSHVSQYEKSKHLKKQLYELSQKSIRDELGIAKIQDEIEIIEKILAKNSIQYRQEQKANHVTFADIASKLKENEVAIEFTNYDMLISEKEDSLIYAAYILKPDQTIHVVPLCSAKELSSTMTVSNDLVLAMAVDKERGKKRKSKNTLKETGIKVKKKKNAYKLLWNPIDSLLTGVETVYFSPSGLINKINLNAIEVNDSTVIADKYNLVNLMSTRTIALEKLEYENKNAVTIGGVDFNGDRVQRTSSNNSKNDTWEDIPGSDIERNGINNLLQKADFKVSSFNKQDATESTFKQLGRESFSPRVIHLATHGFFFPTPEKDQASNNDNIFQDSENPLMRTGLILAGANQAWSGNKTSNKSEDGVLTAYEISNMNLSNTELVVLSACETGLGDIKGSEGVYGLQRAFKMAGVQNIIMSLWKVSDEATAQFMIQFYTNWLNQKLSIDEAFNKTQLEMKEKFEDKNLWAAFVLIQ